MSLPLALVGALLAGAPPDVRDPRLQPGFLLNFSSEDTYATVLKKLGPHELNGDFPGYRIWHYRVNTRDSHEYSHTVCFDVRDGTLVSITRSFEPEENIEAVFPDGSYTVHYWRDDAQPDYGVRVRRLQGERLLIAMGSPKPGMPTSQLMLIRRSALGHFVPWLAKQFDRRE